jgi:hypothetical protein
MEAQMNLRKATNLKLFGKDENSNLLAYSQEEKYLYKLLNAREVNVVRRKQKYIQRSHSFECDTVTGTFQVAEMHNN